MLAYISSLAIQYTSCVDHFEQWNEKDVVLIIKQLAIPFNIVFKSEREKHVHIDCHIMRGIDGFNRHVTKNIHRKDTTREIDVLLISSKEDRNARWSDSFANVEREDDAMLRSERIQCTMQSGQFRFIQKYTQTDYTIPTR